LAIQSSSQIDVDGDLKSDLFKEVYELPTDVKVKTKWVTPWKVSIGGMYKLNQKLAMNLDVSMNLYSGSEELLSHEIENTVIENELSPADSIIGLSGNGLETNFKNAINIGIGFEYVPSNSLSYRISYLYNQSAQEKSMYSHLFPNIDQHWFSAGIGITQSKFLIDITLSYALGLSTSIDDNSAVLGGEYKSQLFIPSVTIKYTL
jgi:long-subunit fatty acid transport protein